MLKMASRITLLPATTFDFEHSQIELNSKGIKREEK